MTARTLISLTVLMVLALVALPDDRALATGSQDTTELSAGSVQQLRASLDGAVQGTGGSNARWSILARSLDRGDQLYARSPRQSLAPASNVKLFTTAAALAHLGPDYRFSTFMLATGPIQDGVLMGDLYLYGTGDPTIGTRFAASPAGALVALSDSLAALGVREIRGDLVGDGSYFSGPRTGAGWQEDYMNAWYAAPAGALSVHENIVRIEVTAGEDGALEYHLTPGGEGIAIRHDTTHSGRLRVRRMDYDGPVVVLGRTGQSASHAVSVADTEMYAAALFRDVLEERGIVLNGDTRGIIEPGNSPVTAGRSFPASLDDDAPRLRVLAVHRSEPLMEVLTVINQQSHNFYAEQLLRTVGRVANGAGSAEAGAAAVMAILAEADVDTTQVQIVDGAGLSPLNRATAESFVGLLAYMAASPSAEPFMESLPVAGEVRRFRRMGGTPAGGNLRAKTGTIEGVSALSGYVNAANGELIAFSIIGNDLGSVGSAKSLENTIGARLAAFDRGGGATGQPRAGSP